MIYSKLKYRKTYSKLYQVILEHASVMHMMRLNWRLNHLAFMNSRYEYCNYEYDFITWNLKNFVCVPRLCQKCV